MHPLHYHEATKHQFHRFARSLGHLDWATQPDPFRRFPGAPLLELRREPLATDVVYQALFDGGAPLRPLDEASLAEFLRCSMGLSAWKQYGTARWALRVNPSSGNLHPTEAYVIWQGRVCHYAVREHALEERCVLEPHAWSEYMAREPAFLVALTSIHWREAWKYGERAFRYCQHDAGHAIAALRLAAALLGWRLMLLPRWSDAQVAAVLGTARDEDYVDAEREEPECIGIVTPRDPGAWVARDPAPLVQAAARAAWRGTANQLSPGHVEWPIIDDVAEATRYPGHTGTWRPEVGASSPATGGPAVWRSALGAQAPARAARDLFLARRSALAFDGRGMLRRASLFRMLRRLDGAQVPWDAIDWEPHVHLAMFIHRVEGVTPGVYAYLRDPAVLSEWRAAMRPEFLWEPVRDVPEATAVETSNPPRESTQANTGDDRLFLLVPIDCRRAANRISCDQEIAEDGFFSLGMIARCEMPLRERGAWFYRRLFWECGVIGQILYLEAEAAGARATGIGCFYDDPVHELLGLSGYAWQSLYHFSMGVPVDDTRLTSESGYAWEVEPTEHR